MFLPDQPNRACLKIMNRLGVSPGEPWKAARKKLINVLMEKKDKVIPDVLVILNNDEGVCGKDYRVHFALLSIPIILEDKKAALHNLDEIAKEIFNK